MQNAGSRVRAATRRSVGSRPRRRLEETVVVIGNGMVGYKFCERLIALGGRDTLRLVVFGEEQQPAYDRIHLTDLLGGREKESLTLAPSEWYRSHGIQLHLNNRVTEIDRERKLVRAADGTETAYDHLVLATGSRAFVPPMEGTRLTGVFVYRTLPDLEAIQVAASQSYRAAVIGGGLLGLEAAKALHHLGLETHLIESGSGLMARQLGPEGAAILRQQVESLGLHIRVNTETLRIEPRGDERVLVFRDQDPLGVDIVILAAGIRPRDELAQAAGLTLGKRGGIEVDNRLQTSDPRIFAIGECASHKGVIYGLVAPGYKMATVVARNLTGKRARFEGDDLSAKLKLMGVQVTTLGDFQGNGYTVKVQQEGVFRELVLHGGRLIGATIVGDWAELNRVQEAIEGRRRIWPWQLNRFRKTGSIWPRSESVHVSQWPASAMVCNCMRIPRGALTRAMSRSGCRTVDALAGATGASTVCGSCKPLLAELLGERSQATAARIPRGLLIASVTAVVGVAFIALINPWPFTETVQAGWTLDQLWRTGWIKQTTGYTLLGLIVLSLALSLRKRFRWFSRIEFGWWRSLHTVLGTISLVALVSHTGFRMGHNLNFVLMLNFAILVVLGGLAGGLTALEASARGPWPRRLRSWWTTTHTLLFWPLPALLLFHVFKVYYY